MGKFYVLPRISAFFFALLPIALTNKNDWMLGVIAVMTILPLIIFVVAAVYHTRRTHTKLIYVLSGYRTNYIDIAFACLGIMNCVLSHSYPLSIIWILSLCFAIAELLFPLKSNN